MFRSTSQNEFKQQKQSKALPVDFAQQILSNDILFVLSEYTNNDALKNLIQLYMLGVEHFKEHDDRAYEYFELKLKNIFTNPGILRSNESTREQTKQSTPQTNTKINIPTVNVNSISNYSILNKPLTSKKAPENNILSFSFQEPSVTQADKFFMCAPPPNKQLNNSSQFIGKSLNPHSESSKSGEVQNWDEDNEVSEKKNSVKEEKIQYIEEQVQEDRFILQEQAKAMAQQSKKQEKRISQQIEAGLHGQESIIQKRQELRKLRSQFSMHNLNKTQSTPIMKSTEQYKTPQQQQNAICIPEEAGEIGSSNLPSNKKVEISQFTFKEESQ